jgi:asparagine synthase (glutamine-hydrolysing)
MCGICGYFGRFDTTAGEQRALDRMTGVMVHRGPDSEGRYVNGSAGLGFRRLSLVDLTGGHQPLLNENGQLALICNGEIYNHAELRKELIQSGHTFKTRSDVEVILHLYEQCGYDLLNRLNGQFAFALYDSKKRSLFLARDHFGICPLYYTVARGVFIFASEIKAILQHPWVERSVDLTGLDQVLSFPGLVSPRTLFKDIHSLKSGHYIVVDEKGVQTREYWDLDYPREDEVTYDKTENEYLAELECALEQAVQLRLQADVPVGFYLSGGLDSSLMAALIQKVKLKEKLHSFAIDFEDKSFSEGKYQKLVARHVASNHHAITFGWEEIAGRLERVIHHCECPIKETYNTASFALSECARSTGVSAILTGEGADELFAGYVGYRFDQLRQSRPTSPNGSSDVNAEDQIRQKLWGDAQLFYEQDYGALGITKRKLYSRHANGVFDDFNCLNFDLVRKDRLQGRHFIHRRSYLDFKLRMSDHLLSDHGDRMVLAHSVEARYPFLDRRVVSLATELPPWLKLNGFVEKYALRKVAEKLLPRKVAWREKYAFVAPGSSYLLQQRIDWVEDLLSYDRIRREGYFDPDMVQELRQRYSQPGFKLNLPFESDFLMVILTFGLFLEAFQMPTLN